MLTKHEKTSQRRMLTGAGATAALLVGGLGLTASGTPAAETVRTSVESAVGVDLASLELPALPQAEPLPPPPGPPLPPTSLAPVGKKHVRVVIRDKDGKVREMSSDDGDIDVEVPEGATVEKRTFVFRRDKDGKPMRWDRKDFPPMPPMPPEAFARLKDMPEISSRNCRDGEGKKDEHVINRKDGDKRITIICTNRIEKMASLAALDGERAASRPWVLRRNAEAAALDGLRSARRSIESNRDMADAGRASALAGIDQAIRELEAKRD